MFGGAKNSFRLHAFQKGAGEFDDLGRILAVATAAK
jgi:hypothetical protein